MKIDVKGLIVSTDDSWIYDWLGYENCSPGKVNSSIAKANGEKLDVYINSEGGDVFAGSEIYEALRTYPGECKIHIVGIAASAASVIACARESEIAPTAMLMVHNVSAQTCGDYKAMDKQSEILQKANKTIAAAYVAKTGMTEAEALKMMDKETWLTAAEAVEKGLADRISQPEIRLAASLSNSLLPPETVAKIKGILTREKSLQTDEKQRSQAQLDLLKLGGIYD